MRRRLISGALLVLSAVAAVSCGSAGPTPAEAVAACRKDPSSKCCDDADCGLDELCDFSLICAQGSDHEVTCDPPMGDRTCHARCDVAKPCAGGQTCQPRTIYGATDTGSSVEFCAAP
jgi:hypothetical protein